MRNSTTIRDVGRALLMGSAIGVGLAGCTIPVVGTAPTEQTTAESAARNLDYDNALKTRDPALVAKFIESYGHSPQAASLLNQMPPDVLSALPRSAVVGMPERTKRQLTPRVRGQLNIPVDTGSDNNSNSGTSSGGYGA